MKINVKSPGKIALSVIVCGFFITSCRDRGAADDGERQDGGDERQIQMRQEAPVDEQTSVDLRPRSELARPPHSPRVPG